MMEDAQPSSTAIGAAILRAAHLVLDGAPRILDDPFALGLSGLPGEAGLRAALERLRGEFASRSDAQFAEEVLRHLRASILLRNRYAEDELERAMARGVRQYVLLGAGLDSFVLRRRDLMARLQVFELDLPATQDWKTRRLEGMGVALPEGLHFVAADFARGSVMDSLGGSAFRREEPAFFSWLGVTGYLTEAAIFATLADLARAAAGSAVVFSYGIREELVAESGRRLNDILKAGIAARGEPAANSGFDPARLVPQMRELGFSAVEDLGVAEAEARYFAGRDDGLCAPPMIHMMVATV